MRFIHTVICHLGVKVRKMKKLMVFSSRFISCALLLSFAQYTVSLTGPDSQLIYEENGYDYLAQNFPNLDYIDRCYIVEEEEAEIVAEEL